MEGGGCGVAGWGTVWGAMLLRGDGETPDSLLDLLRCLIKTT